MAHTKLMQCTLLLSIMLAATLNVPMAHAGALLDASRGEIESLLSKLQLSGCRFQRNGTWYSAEEAKVHLTRKLDYLVEKGAVENAEQFIERAASKSSMTGQRYLVKCGSMPTVQSSQWLHAVLQQIRVRPGSAAGGAE